MKKTLLIAALFVTATSVFAQKKTTSSATVTFDATTPIDALPKAENKTVVASLDTKSGAVAFEAPVKNFAFTNPMIQDHFNGDKWLNSNEFPAFTFKGKVADLKAVKFDKDGTYSSTVDGDLTVKGKTNKVKAPVTFVVKGGKITSTSNFTIVLADYGIAGAPIDGGKVAKEPKISVAADF
ncbi:MAG: YceI family protein [Chitinophagaceae bacterium]|nr:MAG: YceI family protein [Chitinophagaceae bacterium]